VRAADKLGVRRIDAGAVSEVDAARVRWQLRREVMVVEVVVVVVMMMMISVLWSGHPVGWLWTLAWVILLPWGTSQLLEACSVDEVRVL